MFAQKEWMFLESSDGFSKLGQGRQFVPSKRSERASLYRKVLHRGEHALVGLR